jgi:hypothetical protein
MKAYAHLWQYLAEFFIEKEMFQTKVVEKIKTHILCSILFFQKWYCLWDNVEKYGRARQATGDVIWHICFACWITKATDVCSECVVLIDFSLATVLMWTHLSVLLILVLLSCCSIMLFCLFCKSDKNSFPTYSPLCHDRGLVSIPDQSGFVMGTVALGEVIFQVSV